MQAMRGVFLARAASAQTSPPVALTRFFCVVSPLKQSPLARRSDFLNSDPKFQPSMRRVGLSSRQTFGRVPGDARGITTRLAGSDAFNLSDAFNSVIKMANEKSTREYRIRILTNAHCVADMNNVMIRKHGDPNKYSARVVAVGHECDLAMLTTDNEEFWEGTQPLSLGGIPELQDPVAVVGYPTGGDNISVSVGVVSRVEPQQYVHGATSLLAIQIDAAINPGNSGGPAIMNNEVVGVAFQSLEGAENIGFIIPVPIIQHFLKDIEVGNNEYTGFPALGISCQALENSQLRHFYGMTEKETGVLICKIRPLTDSYAKLQKHDVILAVDDQPVGNDGTVAFRNRERISFDYILSSKYSGDYIDVKILRNKERLTVQVAAKPLQHLVPIQQYDLLPRYLIYAGLVFTPLSQPYLHEYGDDWYHTSPRRLCDRAFNMDKTEEDQELVVLSQVLQDKANQGYEALCNLQVLECNGVTVKNLKHLAALIKEGEAGNEAFQQLILDDNRVIILECQKAKDCHAGILLRHRIASDVQL